MGIQYDGPALFDQDRLTELAIEFLNNVEHKPVRIMPTTMDAESAAEQFLSLLLNCNRYNIDLEIAFIKLVEGR